MNVNKPPILKLPELNVKYGAEGNVFDTVILPGQVVFAPDVKVCALTALLKTSEV